MIRISVEACSGDASFTVVVRAKSIERAVSLASERYPGSEMSVLFPLDPETFFEKEGGEFVAEERAWPEVPETVAS